jgi:hypothetical protein
MRATDDAGFVPAYRIFTSHHRARIHLLTMRQPEEAKRYSERQERSATPLVAAADRQGFLYEGDNFMPIKWRSLVQKQGF